MAREGESAQRCDAETARDPWCDNIDRDALLVALVFVPRSYPRNRFFELYREAGAQLARRRAALLRALIEELAGAVSDLRLQRSGDGVVLRFRLPELLARRQSVLTQEELALVQYALESRGLVLPALGPVDPDAKLQIRSKLSRLFRT